MEGTSQVAERETDDAGFTLVELLIAVAVIAILLAVAVPSLLGYTARASTAAAQANVRSALPAVQGYFADHDSYAGMTVAALHSYDTAVELDPLVAARQTGNGYCVASTAAGDTWHQPGPGAAITRGGC